MTESASKTLKKETKFTTLITLLKVSDTVTIKEIKRLKMSCLWLLNILISKNPLSLNLIAN